MGRKSREKRERKVREVEFKRHYVDPPQVKYPVRLRASIGSTGSERLLARLAKDTFLSLWSYPNVVRDEPQGKAVIAKEIADLMIVFEDDIVLFSDKDCRFPSTGNLDIDWSRWFRNAVEKSAKQLWGAERHIRQHPHRIFIDSKCKIQLPIQLPGQTRMRIHRVVVAHGASQRCREALGGSGSLMIMPQIIGDDHKKTRANGGAPFAIGRVSATNPFVHVLDDTSLELLLKNLDTVSDFVGYIRKKEAFIESGRLGMAAGEEALLGLYVAKLNGNDEHDFVVSAQADDTPIALSESRWHEFLKSGERRRQREADKVSYLWDGLIEQFAGHFMAGTSHHLSEVDSTHGDFEKVLRFFARESRLRRRVLSSALVHMHRTTPATRTRLRVVPPMRPGDPYWVLLLFPFANNLNVGERVPYERYRAIRQEYLNCCLRVAKLKWPEALDIVGFATESGRESYGSEDAAYLDARIWTDQMQRDARTVQEKLQILITPNMIATHISEYPKP
ncbi:MAG TPA: hypothetical protein VKB50_07205 [Vicinamibacterales bacterium]|nr:hypothetical protein [Vicinamibacterales bacterium]